MKKCELCRLPASLYCESDEASLCAGCDLKVHEANFLVARHFRRLLCKRCQCPTPWKACGARLGNTETECYQCAAEDEIMIVGRGGVGDEVFNNDESYSDHNEKLEEGEGENEVQRLTASWSTDNNNITISSSSSSSSSACASRSTTTLTVPLKSMREYDYVDDVTDTDHKYSSSSTVVDYMLGGRYKNSGR